MKAKINECGRLLRQQGPRQAGEAKSNCVAAERGDGGREGCAGVSGHTGKDSDSEDSEDSDSESSDSEDNEDEAGAGVTLADICVGVAARGLWRLLHELSLLGACVSRALVSG